MDLIKKHIEEISALCLKHKVKSLFVFGSILTKQFNKNSDIDFLVEFDQIFLIDYADNFFDFKFSLEDLLGRDIDLLETQAVKNPFLKKELDKTKQSVYGIAS